ncbi:MAG: hypothetical protein QM690_11705 [Sphingobium sp.]
MAASLITPLARRKAKFKARPRPQLDRKDLIERAFDGFERTFEGLAK